MRRRVAVTLIGAGCVIACSSLPDLTFTDDGGSFEGGSSGSSGDGGFDSGRDTSVDTSVDSCPHQPEICNDGIDNDCDGDTDCEDKDCQPDWSCQDAPAGWSVVHFAGATQPTCPATEVALDVKSILGDGNPGGSCGCACGDVGGSCKGGASSAITVWDGSTCNGVTAVTGPQSVSSSITVCTALTTPVAVTGNSAGGSSAKRSFPTGPTSCTTTPTTTKNGAVTDGRACTATAYGKGCTNPAQVCAPKQAAGLSTCVAKPGAANACPTGFAKQNQTGSAVTDDRACNGCACANSACGGSVQIFSDDGCATGGNKDDDVIAADGACHVLADVNNNAGFAAVRYKSTGTGGCGVTALGTFSGGLTFTDPRTICCK